MLLTSLPTGSDEDVTSCSEIVDELPEPSQAVLASPLLRPSSISSSLGAMVSLDFFFSPPPRRSPGKREVGGEGEAKRYLQI